MVIIELVTPSDITVDLAAVKTYLQVEDFTEDDTIITELYKSAVLKLEELTGLLFRDATVKAIYPIDETYYLLPRYPVGETLTVTTGDVAVTNFTESGSKAEGYTLDFGDYLFTEDLIVEYGVTAVVSDTMAVLAKMLTKHYYYNPEDKASISPKITGLIKSITKLPFGLA